MRIEFTLQMEMERRRTKKKHKMMYMYGKMKLYVLHNNLTLCTGHIVLNLKFQHKSSICHQHLSSVIAEFTAKTIQDDPV